MSMVSYDTIFGYRFLNLEPLDSARETMRMAVAPMR